MLTPNWSIFGSCTAMTEMMLRISAVRRLKKTTEPVKLQLVELKDFSHLVSLYLSFRVHRRFMQSHVYFLAPFTPGSIVLTVHQLRL